MTLAVHAQDGHTHPEEDPEVEHGPVQPEVAPTPEVKAPVSAAATVATTGTTGTAGSSSSAPSTIARPRAHSSDGSSAQGWFSALKLQERDGMLRLPGGTFAMGSSDPAAAASEKPVRTVTLSAFWLDRTEVTVAAYRECVDRKLCLPPAKNSASCTYDLGVAELPVNCVSFALAEVFCRAQKKRLPKEAEWEFAARGQRAVRFPWGGVQTSCALTATLRSDSSGRTCTGDRPARVGTHPRSASVFGIQDLAGNVEEWTQDFYSEDLRHGAPRAGTSHVLRGGSWLMPPFAARTTARDFGSAMEAGAGVGFRCARDGSM